MKSLDELINLYHARKGMADIAKKESDELNKEIKKRLTEEGLDEYQGKEYSVSRTVINADKLDESALMEKLKKEYPDVAEQVIQKVEVLDVDKLEDLVYNRVIKADVVNSCIVHRTPTIRLNIRKNKEDEEND